MEKTLGKLLLLIIALSLLTASIPISPNIDASKWSQTNYNNDAYELSLLDQINILELEYNEDDPEHLLFFIFFILSVMGFGLRF